MDVTVARTARMILRPLTVSDAIAATAEWGLLAENEQENRDWIATWCVQQQTLHGLGYWGCWRSADQRLVAFCGWRSHDLGIALGFGVAADFRKQGYASEAAAAAMEWAVSRYGPDPLFASVRPPNPASVAVLTRVGMVRRLAYKDAQGDRWIFSLPDRLSFGA